MTLRVSDNRELVEEVRRKLRDNDGYCPCKLIKDETTKCPCAETINELPVGQECHCGLYIKVEN